MLHYCIYFTPHATVFRPLCFHRLIGIVSFLHVSFVPDTRFWRLAVGLACCRRLTAIHRAGWLPMVNLCTSSNTSRQKSFRLVCTWLVEWHWCSHISACSSPCLQLFNAARGVHLYCSSATFCRLRCVFFLRRLSTSETSISNSVHYTRSEDCQSIYQTIWYSSAGKTPDGKHFIRAWAQ